MATELEALEFFSRRLHSRHRGSRVWLGEPRRVTRRICMRLPRGATEVIPDVDRSVVVRCAAGSLWLTHDGDPKDVMLGANQSYRAERQEPLRVHALQPCVVEIEFEDELTAAE
jgi:hypothetical protein